MKWLLFMLSLIFAQVFGVTQHVYVAFQGSNAVQIIDVAEDNIQTIFGFEHPRVVKVSPDGTTAYIGEDSGKIWAFDTLTHLLPPVYISVNHPVALAISPDSNYLYVASKNNSISIIELEGFSIQSVLTGLDNLQDIRISPDGSLLYAVNGGSGNNASITVINTVDNAIIATIDIPGNPLGVAFTNNGNYAYVTDKVLGILYKIQTSNHTIVKTVLGLNLPKYIAMTPDNNFAYISNSGNQTIAVLQLSDDKIVEQIPVADPGTLAVTSDGDFLYVGSKFGITSKIRTFDNIITDTFTGYNNPSNMSVTNNNEAFIPINGCQVTNPTLYNHITWTAPSGHPLYYKIYTDASLTLPIVTVTGETFEFFHTTILSGQTYKYYVVAVFSDGFSATLGNVEVSPERTCIHN